jgi:hypothetical protein
VLVRDLRSEIPPPDEQTPKALASPQRAQIDKAIKAANIEAE